MKGLGGFRGLGHLRLRFRVLEFGVQGLSVPMFFFEGSSRVHYSRWAGPGGLLYRNYSGVTPILQRHASQERGFKDFTQSAYTPKLQQTYIEKTLRQLAAPNP